MARKLYELTVWLVDPKGDKQASVVSAHIDLDDDERRVRDTLRTYLIDGVERYGWRRKDAWKFQMTVREPGWKQDAIAPYVISREEL